MGRKKNNSTSEALQPPATRRRISKVDGRSSYSSRTRQREGGVGTYIDAASSSAIQGICHYYPIIPPRRATNEYDSFVKCITRTGYERWLLFLLLCFAGGMPHSRYAYYRLVYLEVYFVFCRERSTNFAPPTMTYTTHNNPILSYHPDYRNNNRTPRAFQPPIEMKQRIPCRQSRVCSIYTRPEDPHTLPLIRGGQQQLLDD